MGFGIKTKLRTLGRRLLRDNVSTAVDDEGLYRNQYDGETLAKRQLYNFGAGSFLHRYWTNVDYDSDWYAKNRANTLSGVAYDMLSLQPVDIADNSAAVAYTSHTIEHLPDNCVQHVFAEIHRLLRPEGVFRVTCPNAELYYRALQADDHSFFFWTDWYRTPEQYGRIGARAPLATASIEQKFLWSVSAQNSTLHADSPLDAVTDAQLRQLMNRYKSEELLAELSRRCDVNTQRKYPGQHINWHTPSKVTQMLKDAGFGQVELSAYGQSAVPVMRNLTLFDNTHPKISLYIEATK